MSYTVMRVVGPELERAAEVADEQAALDVVEAFLLEGVPPGTHYEVCDEDGRALWTTKSGALERV